MTKNTIGSETQQDESIDHGLTNNKTETCELPQKASQEYIITKNKMDYEKLKLYKINYKYHNETQIKITLPADWNVEICDDYRCVNFIDENGRIRFYEFSKNEIHDSYSYVKFYSEDESENIFNANNNDEMKKINTKHEINKHCQETYDKTYMYIIYLHTSGRQKAKEYFAHASYIPPEEIIGSFDKHYFIGFVKSEQQFEQICEIILKYKDLYPSFSQIIMKKLPDGLDNLWCYEKANLFNMTSTHDERTIHSPLRKKATIIKSINLK